jgi:hypothetical protein
MGKKTKKKKKIEEGECPEYFVGKARRTETIRKMMYMGG